MRRFFILLAALGTATLLLAGCAASARSPGAAAPSAGAPSASESAASSMSDSMGNSNTESTTPRAVSGTALIGRKIFLAGVTPNGMVKFRLGSEDVGNGACANCHGKDAGGGDGPMISWSMLTSTAKMKKMPKYAYTTPEQVATAVTTGVRPDGTKLKHAMPRYQLTPPESAAVVAYLKALE